MKKIVSTTILLYAGLVYSGCPDLYPPNVNIPKLENTVELCNSFFVSVYDKNNKAVIFVSEKLSDHTAIGSSKRINAFSSDSRVKNGPKNSDYTYRSGYDKGHMTPAGDSSSDTQMKETFLLTNMTPQEPTVNRNSWKNLEEKVRKQFSKTSGNMHILNIAVYTSSGKRIGSGIPVPSGYWKVVYTSSGTKYFYVVNVPNAKVKEMSNIDVTKLIKNSQNF